MEKNILKSLYIEKLKGLHDVNIVFEKPLTAIMGVNGAGKTTVIHALACMYRPDGNGEDFKFPYFFTPNTDATWRNSKIVATMLTKDRSGNDKIISRTYKKDYDRWSPRYDSRPLRNVYYLGISSCMPEIEQTNSVSVIHYTTQDCDDRISQKVITKAAFILNKDYTTLTQNLHHGKSMIGIKAGQGLKYSSLSMGTGEQRTIRILQKIYSAEQYSLVLIDEIDLLMHVSALRRLIKVLHDVAVERNIQIVFTTHALEMCKLDSFVGIQYLHTIKMPDHTFKTFVYNRISVDLIYTLTGHTTKPLCIYVEDAFARGIVKSLASSMGLSAKLSIRTFGAATNGFTLAAGLLISAINVENSLIVLDGDCFIGSDAKLVQMKKVLSGTEEDIEARREQALSLMTQFDLPHDTSPEKFFHECLIEQGDPDNELVMAAQEIEAVSDQHEWIGEIQSRTGEDPDYLVRRIVEIISASEKWDSYIQPIKTWLEQHADV